MNVRARRSGSVLAVLLLLTACSHFTGGQPFVPQPQLAPPETGALVVRITVPHGTRAPHYLSPSSKGMTVEIRGPTKFNKTVGLTVGAKGCKSKLMDLQCALRVTSLKQCPAKKACYTATIRTYDAYAHKKIPPGAHLLSVVSGLKFSIRSGTTFVPLVLEGIPASVAVIPSASSALAGTQTAGFIYPKCEAAPQTVTLIGLDADGNYIVGPGAPSTSLTSGTPAQMSVRAAGANAFTLNQPIAPAYAFGNRTIVMSAGAKPGGKGLGAGIVSHVNVTYSGDICGTFTEFTIPTSNSEPSTISRGPDGNVWVPESGAAKIARLTASGVFSEFPVAAASTPFEATSGPDGNVWFTENGNGAIGKMTTSGAILFEKKTAVSSSPYGIAVGSDPSVLWFIDDAVGGKIGAITTAGTLLPEASTLTSFPFFIASGPDGALWFTEQGGGGHIGRITTGGVVTDYPTTSANSAPTQIVSAHGAMWFTETDANKIGRIDGAGNVTEYTLPGALSFPWGITGGPDGDIWFTELNGDKIGRMALDGTFHEYAIPTAHSAPEGMTVGADGAIWFVEYSANKVGRLR